MAIVRPESYGAVGNGVTDDRAALQAMVTAMASGDSALFTLDKNYFCNGTISVDKSIVLAGEQTTAHRATPRAKLSFGSGYLGLRLLRTCAVQDLNITGAGTDPTGHGMYCRASPKVERCSISGFGGHGLALDASTVSARVNAGTVASNVLTLNLESNSGNLRIVAGMIVSLLGYTVATPGAGAVLATEATTIVTLPLVTANGDLVGLTKNITSTNVSAGICTAVLNNVTGLAANMKITTAGLSTNAVDTTILTLVAATNTITYASGGAGSLGSGTAQVTRGMLSTAEDCSHWYANNVVCSANRGHGFYVDGTSNAGLAEAVESSSNYQSGFWDQSTLGNIYSGCYANANNQVGSSSGYGFGNLTGFPAFNKPSTAGSNRSKFINCHAETNQPDPYCTFPAYAIPGFGNWTGDGIISPHVMGYNRPDEWSNPNGVGTSTKIGDEGIFVALECTQNNTAAGGARPYRWQYYNTGPGNKWFSMRYNNSSGIVPFAISGEESQDSAGLVGAGQLWAINGLNLGFAGMGKINSEIRGTNLVLTYWDSAAAPTRLFRAIGWGAAAPVAGTWRRGDIIWNSAAAVGAPMGWTCVATGSPGTWAAQPNL